MGLIAVDFTSSRLRVIIGHFWIDSAVIVICFLSRLSSLATQPWRKLCNRKMQPSLKQ